MDSYFKKNYFGKKRICRSQRMHVDKDILVKGNRIYSPDTCIIVPQRINMLFMERRNKRIYDTDLPIGITKTQSGKFHAEYNTKRLGNFETLVEAIDVYSKEKEDCVHRIAEEYKNEIPEKVYNALIKWTA